MNKCSLTLIEFLTALCIILILLGTFAGYANIVLRTARETALQNELMNIRMSIEHYRAIHNQLPLDLITLTKKDLVLDNLNVIINNIYLEPMRVDKEGNLLDPFLNKYHYNNQNGWVRSDTKEYESW